MRNFVAAASLFFLGCSVRNSLIRNSASLAPCPGQQAGGQNLSDDEKNTTPNGLAWLTGFLRFSYNMSGISAQNPANLTEQCSSIMEFERSDGKYFVRMQGNENCLDFFPKSDGGELSVWYKEDSLRKSGYLRVKVLNPSLALLVGLTSGTPDVPDTRNNPMKMVPDIFEKSGLNPMIQMDIATYLDPLRLDFAKYYCGTTEDLNDAPTPENCIWPHGLRSGRWPIEAIPAASTPQDLDVLVERTQEFKIQRESATSIAVPIDKALRDYDAERDVLNETSMKRLQWLYLKRIMDNSDRGFGAECNKTPELRARCARALTKYIIPEKSAFVEKAISLGFPESMATEYTEEMNRTVVADYSKALENAIFRWKFIYSTMKSERNKLSVIAHLPDSSGSTSPQAMPLFPPVGSGSTALAGVHWTLLETFLTVNFDASQQLLRRSMDAGSVILLGDYPVLSMANYTPQEDAGTMMPLPLPLPQPKPTSTTPNCPK